MTGRIRRLLHASGAFRWLRSSRTAIYNGRGFVIPITHRSNWSVPEDERPWSEALLRALLPMFPGAFVDVGAHVGYGSLKVKALDPDRTCFAFDANPVCAGQLLELVRVNALADVTVQQIALTDRSGTARLLLFAGEAFDPTATLVPLFKPAHPAHMALDVPCARLDDLVKAPGVVHIAARGGELEVLKGMTATLGTSRPALILMLQPVFRTTLVEQLRRQEDLEGILRDAGYALFEVRPNVEGVVWQRMVRPIGIRPDPEDILHVAVPQERPAALDALLREQAPA